MIYDLAAARADEQTFRALLDEAAGDFAPIVEDTPLDLETYHRVLYRIFHQVYSSSGTFSLAAARCPARHGRIREYLMAHAEEEKTHWRWILNDLERTGYAGPDPRGALPPAETLSYVALNHYIAEHQPVARLGIAAMLETLGASFGKRAATRLIAALSLQPAQCSFFLGHGDTDVGHTEEILQVLRASELTPEEWGWLCLAARAAAGAYSQVIAA